MTFKYSLYQLGRRRPVARGSGSTTTSTVFTDPDLLGDPRTRLQADRLLQRHPGRARACVVATVIRRVAAGRLGTAARTVLFLPQVIPLVAAGIAWSWMLSSTGVVNQVLAAIGLGGVTRAWLGDFGTALPAVGVIGAWVLLGLCTVLLLAGMSKIDPALYEAARLDGAGPVREFVSITLPSLRQEIGVCVTVTVIAALASFDIVYISTQRRPGRRRRWCPGLEIYQLAFSNREVGLASALAVVLMVLVLVCVLPIQWLTREDGRDDRRPRETSGRAGCCSSC